MGENVIRVCPGTVRVDGPGQWGRLAEEGPDTALDTAERLETKSFLKALSEGSGVSGYEGPIGAMVAEAFRPFVDEVRFDKLGNCIGLRRGEKPKDGPPVKVMLAGHMDEIGLIVTKVEERGFLRFTDVGGVDQRTLPAQEVVVHGRKDLPGVIGVKPPHLVSPDEAAKALKKEDLYIDLGLTGAEAKKLVNVGDLITLRRDFTELKNGLVAGKAFDDRAGVAVIYEALLQLEKLHHTADVYAVATVQEETGLRGAITSAYGVVPDLGVAIDVSFGDQPGVPEHQTAPLDKGPGVAVGGNIHPKVYEALTRIAGEQGISLQIEASPGATGTDAWAMQVSRAGVPTGLIGIPLRSMHTSVETLAMGDIKKAGRLLALFIASVDRAFVEGLRW